MLSKDDLAKRMALTSDGGLLVIPRWTLEHVEQPARELTSLTQAQMNEFVLSKTTNNRLPIHLGPLLYLFKRRQEFERATWNNNNPDDFIVDLSKLPEGYPLQSGETVVAASAEYFRFPDDLAGFVISRVGNHLSGIDVSTTFIDAGWHGIITFQITNVDSHPRILKLGLEVARLFVFELSSPQTGAAGHATNESHHAGVTWQSVLQGNRSPFERVTTPARAIPAPTSEQAPGNAVSKLLMGPYSRWCEKHDIRLSVPPLFVMAAATAFFVWTYFAAIADVWERASQFKATLTSVASIAVTTPERKVAHITVRKGSSAASARLLLNETRVNRGEIPMVVVRSTGFPADIGLRTVDAVIAADNGELELSVRLARPLSADTLVNVEYAVLWREKDKNSEGK